jgi:hypothetical protein
MTRLTITLSVARHRALEEAAGRTGYTIDELVDASLAAHGIGDAPSAADLVMRARERAGLGEHEALELALRETRAVRDE